VDGQPVELDLADENGRYHRQELISWWAQDRLAQARVLVIGAGALGNEILKNLALVGVGSIVVVDLDTVENSNLSRCVLFRPRDDGRPKAEVAAAAIRELNPDVHITAIVGDVRTDVGLGLFAAADVVIGGLDNREARLHTNVACWKVNTPWIDGAIEGLMGTMRLFVPPDSACYECTMSEHDHKLLAFRKSCALLTREQMLQGKVPTTAPTASVIAAMQVQEAVKLLHADRVKSDFAGKGFAYNGLTHDSYVVTYRRDPECFSHDTYAVDSSVDVPGSATFSTLLTTAEPRLAGAVLDLEHEIVMSLECAACRTSERVRQPLERITAESAVCPTCGADRRPETLHSIGAQDSELLALRPSDLGLPRYDYVTARAGLERLHLHLDGDAEPFGGL
jgi:molybdopterin/thiamine biosynthesis adenylyltransferase